VHRLPPFSLKQFYEMQRPVEPRASEPSAGSRASTPTFDAHAESRASSPTPDAFAQVVAPGSNLLDGAAHLATGGVDLLGAALTGGRVLLGQREQGEQLVSSTRKAIEAAQRLAQNLRALKQSAEGVEGPVSAVTHAPSLVCASYQSARATHDLDQAGQSGTGALQQVADALRDDASTSEQTQRGLARLERARDNLAHGGGTVLDWTAHAARSAEDFAHRSGAHAIFDQGHLPGPADFASVTQRLAEGAVSHAGQALGPITENIAQTGGHATQALSPVTENIAQLGGIATQALSPIAENLAQQFTGHATQALGPVAGGLWAQLSELGSRAGGQAPNTTDLAHAVSALLEPAGSGLSTLRREADDAAAGLEAALREVHANGSHRASELTESGRSALDALRSASGHLGELLDATRQVNGPASAALNAPAAARNAIALQGDAQALEAAGQRAAQASQPAAQVVQLAENLARSEEAQQLLQTVAPHAEELARQAQNLFGGWL
jgi:hypothetical protein